MVNILPILKKYRFLIILACIALSYRLIFLPVFHKWENTKSQIQLLEEKLVKAMPLLADEEKVNRLYNVLTKLTGVQIQKRKIDPQVIAREIYQTLADIANRYNIRIRNYKPNIKQLSTPKKKIQSRYASNYKVGKKIKRYIKPSIAKRQYSIEMNLDLEAKLPDFIRFVYYLENSPQLMEISEARLRASYEGILLINLKIKKLII